jgi:hypothetical protein
LRPRFLLSIWFWSLRYQCHAYGISSCHDVEQQRLTRIRGYHDRWPCEVLLELLECHFCLLYLYERFGLP